MARTAHTPVVVHVTELTQPLGHSTSGSHERYKSKERLAWEKEYDCNLQFRNWILRQGIATASELESIENGINTTVREARTKAWKSHNAPILKAKEELLTELQQTVKLTNNNPNVVLAIKNLSELDGFGYKELLEIARGLVSKLYFGKKQRRFNSGLKI